MKRNILRARFGLVVCLSLLAAGCASPNGSFLSRLNPFERNSHVAATPVESGDLDLKDPASLHLAYGRWREQVGDAKDARVSYETVLRDDPKNVDALVGLARLDYLAGRHQEAEHRLANALRLEPGNAQVLAAQGQLYAAQNRWPQAIDQLNAAVLAAPNTAEYRYQLAVALAHSSDPDSALPHFAKTVGPAEAHYNLGYLLQEQGRTREAERHLVEALRQRPDLHVAQTLLSEVRGGSPLRTAPAIAQVSEPARRPAPQPQFTQTALTASPTARRPAPSAPSAPPFETPDPGPNPFAPFPAATATAAPQIAAAPAGSTWYPTPAARQPEPDGLTAAQREQMLNQRTADGSAFSDAPVRR
jgi:tetratricopeptide (TPR) repeat protein